MSVHSKEQCGFRVAGSLLDNGWHDDNDDDELLPTECGHAVG